MVYRSAPILGLMAAMMTGCGPTYAPIGVETPDGRVAYTLTTQVEGHVYRSTLTRREDNHSLPQRLDGKAEAMALSPNGDALVVALSASGAAVTHRVVLLRADTLATIKQLPILMPALAAGPDGNPPSIQRFDRLALSDDAKTLATYFWKPAEQGGHESVVALWDVATGGLLRELHLPQPDASLLDVAHTENVSSMAFSKDGALLGVCGAWSIKIPDKPQPNGFVRVWRVSDGQDVAAFRPAGQRFLRDMCFDGAGRHVAAWSWMGRATQECAVTVWSLPGGKKVAERTFRTKIKAIRWSDEKDAFEVLHKQGQAYLPPSASTGTQSAVPEP